MKIKVDFWIPWGMEHRWMRPEFYFPLFEIWWFCSIESEWELEGVMRCDAGYLDFWVQHMVSSFLKRRRKMESRL